MESLEFLNKQHKRSKMSIMLLNSSKRKSIKQHLRSRVKERHHVSYGGNDKFSSSVKTNEMTDTRSQIRRKRMNKLLTDHGYSRTPQTKTPEVDQHITPIQKLKRCIRKITLANRFLDSTYGSVKVKVEHDHYKTKYLHILEVMFKTARECYKCRFKTGFLLIYVEILQMTMRVPDLQSAVHAFLSLSLVSFYFKDNINATFALQRLIGLSEQKKDFLTTVKAYEILAWVFEDKKEFKNTVK